MGIFPIVAVMVPFVVFATGLSLVIYSLMTRRVKALESHLFSGYASLLSDEINRHRRFDGPLKVIKSSLPFLENGTDRDHLSEVEGALDSIKNNVQYLKTMLDVRDGRGSFEKYTFNLSDSIALYLLEENYKDKVKLVKTNTVNHTIFGTELEILAIVKIVVDNALDYGGHPVSIELKLAKSRKIRIFVRDRGDGNFPKATLDTINEIDRTYSSDGLWSGGVRNLILKNSDSSIGNGMGLIVAHLIAKAYNGELFLVSRGAFFEGVECELTTVVIELSRS